MYTKVSGTKLPCKYNWDLHCFTFDLSDTTSDEVTVPLLIRSIIHYDKHMTWRKLADFCGVRTSSLLFKLAFCSSHYKTAEALNQQVVIDPETHTAKFYRYDITPEGATTKHVAPSIVNVESKLTVYTKVPTKVLTRLTVQDPLDRMLTMTLTPVNGYLLNVNDNRLAMPDMKYVVSGTRSALNHILKGVHFVGTKAGSGTVVVAVDDNEGCETSIYSTEVSLTIVQSKEPSIPYMVLPVEQSGTVGHEVELDPVAIFDEDHKVLTLKITPFGCRVYGFKSHVFPIEPGNVRIMFGDPNSLNQEIEGLYIYPYQEDAQLGLELSCDSFRDLKYLRIACTKETTSSSTTTEPKPDTTPSTTEEPTEGTTTPTTTDIANIPASSEAHDGNVFSKIENTSNGIQFVPNNDISGTVASSDTGTTIAFDSKYTLTGYKVTVPEGGNVPTSWTLYTNTNGTAISSVNNGAMDKEYPINAQDASNTYKIVFSGFTDTDADIVPITVTFSGTSKS